MEELLEEDLSATVTWLNHGGGNEYLKSGKVQARLGSARLEPIFKELDP